MSASDQSSSPGREHGVGLSAHREAMTKHADLLTRAVSVVDSLDSLDQMAALGAPLDDLAGVLHDFEIASTVIELRRAGADVDRTLDAMALPSTGEWKQSWLHRHGVTDPHLVDRLLRLDADELRTAATDPELTGMVTLYRSAADAAADELTQALAQHTPVEVPDTIPTHWSL